LALRLRDRDRIELFESMDAAVEGVRDGCVRIRLESACHRVIVFVTLDFGHEKLVSEPLAEIECHDDGTADAAKTLLQWARLHRGGFGGNGIVELGGTVTGKRLARSQHYLPPVNSRFPHDEFERMESKLRERASISEQA